MLRVLIVDDQSLICQGLQTMLDLQPDLQVVGTASNGESKSQYFSQIWC